MEFNDPKTSRNQNERDQESPEWANELPAFAHNAQTNYRAAYSIRQTNP